MTLTPTDEDITLNDIAPMFLWSQWAIRDTREGKRNHRYAHITKNLGVIFWKHWRVKKADWIRNGYSFDKDPIGNWRINQWLTIDGKVSERSLSYARETQAAADEKFLPADWIPEGVSLESPQSKLLYSYQRDPAIRLKAVMMGMQPPPGYDMQLMAGVNGNALDASDTGVGKTIVALVVCAELGLRPCVIAPLAVMTPWLRAGKMLDLPMGWVINYDKIRNGRSGLGRWKPITEFDPSAKAGSKMFHFDYLPGDKPVLIFDEVQKAKSPDSLQGQILRDAAKAGHKILMLSATAAKDPTEMRNLGAALGFHDGSYSGFRKFQQDYGCFEQTFSYGSGQKSGYKFDKSQKLKLERLHRQIFPLRGQRIRIADVPDFPETTITADALDTGNTNEIRDAYQEMDRKLAEAATKSGLEKGAMTLAAIMAARVASEKAKIDLFQELAEEGIEEGRSIAIFLNFRAHIEELAKRLKTRSIIWGTDLDGRQQKNDERQKVIDDFQHDRQRFVIVSLMAGGAGISLHDQFNGMHPRLSIISPSFSAIDLKQGLGRVHRAGAKTKSFQRIIFAAGTIEEEICQSMRVKLANLETLNDGALQPSGLAERLQGVKLDGELK